MSNEFNRLTTIFRGYLPMSVVLDPNQNPNNQQGQSSSFSGNQSQQSPFQQKASGRFTNIQKYISANQPAAGQLQSRVEKFGGQQQQKSEKELEPGLSSIRQGIQSEKDRLSQAGNYSQVIKSGDVSQVESLAGIAAPTNQVSTQQVGQSQPLAAQADQSNFNNLQQILKGDTKASEIDTGVGNVLSQAQLAAQKQADIAKSAQTEQGRFGLLKNTIGSGKGYTGGQGLLDNLLLQSSGKGALAGLQQGLQSQAQGLGQKVAGYEKELSPQAQAIIDQQKTARDEINDALGVFEAGKGGALGSLYSNLATGQQQTDAARQAEAAGLRSGLTSKQLTPQQLAALGLSGGERTYNTDLTAYAANIKDAVPSSMTDAASPEQQRMKEALARLSGQDINLGNKTDATYFDQANKDQLKNALDQAKLAEISSAQQLLADQQNRMRHSGSTRFAPFLGSTINSTDELRGLLDSIKNNPIYQQQDSRGETMFDMLLRNESTPEAILNRKLQEMMSPTGQISVRN